jgi:acyl carrier protein
VLIDQRVGDLLVVHLGVEPSRIVDSARLDEDLGLDSLSLTEALLLLEDELAISIPEPVQLELRTFSDLVAVVASQVTTPPVLSGGTLRQATTSPDSSIGLRSPSTSAPL